MREKIEKYIRDWETKCYFNGIPDEVPNEISHLVPSYKTICRVIMKNENNLELLGFTRTKCLIYNDIKRNEINNRLGSVIQLRLF